MLLVAVVAGRKSEGRGRHGAALMDLSVRSLAARIAAPNSDVRRHRRNAQTEEDYADEPVHEMGHEYFMHCLDAGKARLEGTRR